MLLAALGAPDGDTARPPAVAYRIEARVDETTHVLVGRARLRYTHRAARPLDRLIFHQYLNAFRPHSLWARRELAFGLSRFQDLGPDDHAFERLRAVRVDGQPATVRYPYAPDSTVVEVRLPRPLRTGETAVVDLDWEARLATVPRRQGRAGRHYDWAHWYPRIAVFDGCAWQARPHLPQGEFNGEFAGYDVTLEVAADQVLAATGVPVEGDPGWGIDDPALLARGAYPPTPAEPLGLLGPAPAPGAKRVRWRAERVHHFAWSMRPDFVHEGALLRSPARPPVALHVLYQRGDTAWPHQALERAQRALAWLEAKLGPYGWPQLTVVHRLESGGTEFPMLVMNGSASEGLIVHELTHQWFHGMLANNEWREGWLDEGLTTFVTNWYSEDHGADPRAVWSRTLEALRQRERQGQTEPVAWPGARFRDYATYSAMTYGKAAAVLRMLRHLVGPEAFARALRLYATRHRFAHVDEGDLRAAFAQATGRRWDWFFDAWLHSTAQPRLRVVEATTERRPDGRWRTRVVIERQGIAMPVDVAVGPTRVRADEPGERLVIEALTPTPPERVVLDPDEVLLTPERDGFEARVRRQEEAAPRP